MVKKKEIVVYTVAICIFSSALELSSLVKAYSSHKQVMCFGVCMSIIIV